MLLPTSTHTTTSRHLELIEHMHLTCFKTQKKTRTFLRNSKSSFQSYPNCVTRSISSKLVGKEGLYLTILVLYPPWARH